MSTKPLTLFVIPQADGTAVSIRLPYLVLYLIVAVLLFLIVASGMYARYRLQRMVNASAITAQRAENQVLKAKIEDFTRDLVTLDANMETLRRLDRQVRMLCDLRFDDQKVSLSAEKLSSDWRSKSDTEVAAKLDVLVRQVSARKASFSEVLKHAKDQRYTVDHTPSIRPASGWMVAGYGQRKNPFTGRMEMHRGVDIAAPKGTPIYATADGRVSFVGYRGGYGLLVKVDHGQGRSTWYGHCSMAKVRTGNLVKRGQIIATIGKTGQAIGPHVHYEVRIDGDPVNPANFFLSRSEPIF